MRHLRPTMLLLAFAGLACAPKETAAPGSGAGTVATPPSERPSERAKPAANVEPDTAALLKGTPDVTTEAAAWVKEFKADPKAAGEKYKGKLVAVTGPVQFMVSGPNDTVVLALKVEGEFAGFQCRFTNARELWTEVAPGDTATVRGVAKAAGYPAGDLSPCVLSPGHKSIAFHLSAPALVKEAQADPAKADEKYKDRYAYVTGEVVSQGTGKSGVLELRLKGDGGTDLLVRGTGRREAAAGSAQARRQGGGAGGGVHLPAVPRGEARGPHRQDLLQEAVTLAPLPERHAWR